MKIFSLVCLVISDPGDALEVYGDLSVRLYEGDPNNPVELERHTFFQRNDDNTLDLTSGEHRLDFDVSIDMKPGQYIWVGGHLADEDSTSANDNLGFADRHFTFDDLRTHFKGQFVPAFVDFSQDSSGTVELRFQVKYSPGLKIIHAHHEP